MKTYIKSFLLLITIFGPYQLWSPVILEIRVVQNGTAVLAPYGVCPPNGTVAVYPERVERLVGLLTLLEPQSRVGDNPLKFQVVFPQNGTAVVKGFNSIRTYASKPVLCTTQCSEGNQYLRTLGALDVSDTCIVHAGCSCLLLGTTFAHNVSRTNFKHSSSIGVPGTDTHFETIYGGHTRYQVCT